MSQTRAWQVAAVALLALFGFFVFESLRLSLTDALGPGPGFFPFWLGTLGAVLSVVLILQLRLRRAEPGTDPITFDRAGTRNVLAVLAGLVAASAMLELAGFRLAMLSLLVYLLVVLGVRRWAAIALFALAGSFGVYYVFYDLLKVPLP
jgi:putative tricarboxylic transport membrane protein